MGHRQEHSDREGHEGFHGNAKVSMKARQWEEERWQQEIREGRPWKNFHWFHQVDLFLHGDFWILLHYILTSRSSPSWHTRACMSWPNIICPTISLMTSGIFVCASYAESCLPASGISSTSNGLLPPVPIPLKNTLVPGLARFLSANLIILTPPHQNSSFNLNL